MTSNAIGSTNMPTTTAYSTNPSNDCFGEPLESLVPYLSLDASDSASVLDNFDSTVAKIDGLFYWNLNSTSFPVEWDNSTALQVIKNDSTFSTTSIVVRLPTANQWMRLIIETSSNVPHPV